MSESEAEPRALTAVGERGADTPSATGDPDGGGFDASLVSLVLRGDKLPLRNAVSSCYNTTTQQLVVVTAPALYLYGNVLELGGEMLSVVAADENVQFQHALVLPWLDVYSAFAINLNGHIEHRVVSADFSECHLTHVIAERGALFTAFANPFRREVITADSDGGFKVWAIRATAVANSTKTVWKGFQRIHAGSRKTSYSHVYLAGDDQTILACTKTRIHAFDSTTCARIGTFYKDSSHTIVSASFDRDRDTIYLQINESRRHVYKLQGSSFRGRMHSLETCGLCGEEEDIAAFEAIVRGCPRGHNLLEAQSDGIFVLDTMGKLAVATCSRYETSSTRERRSISLPLAPSAEAYVAIHVQSLRHESRNFVIVVCSSGLVVVEAVLPETSMPARRVLTNIAGTKAAMLDVNEQRRIAIFNSLPPSLLLFDENRTDTFFAILLQFPSKHESQAGAVGHRRDPCINSVVDFAGLRCGVVVVWSSGDVTRYCLQTERTITVGEVAATPVVVQSSASWGGSQEEWVFVGDDQGTVSIWEFHSNNTARFVCTKSLHNQRLLSIYPIKGDSVKHSACVVTVANDGEVKLSSLRGLDKNTVAWELLVCFRTYATSLSATGFMGPEFLFCGSEEGGFECWRLPIIPPTHSLEDRSGRHVAVLKRPLHSIDLHLTRVCQVIVEPGDSAQRVSRAQPHLDEFAWVITYDLDHVVLIWCFSTSFLFPHRKLRPHAIPVGGFLTAMDESSFRFYAYLGRCLDSLDVTSGLDTRAIKRRLANARDTDKPASIHNPKHVQIYGKELRNQARQRDKEPEKSPTASVRLRVTLPTATQADALVDLDASRRTSPQKVPRIKPNRELTESPTDITKPSISYSEELMHNEDRLRSEGRSLSPSLGKVTSNSISREEISDAEPRQTLQRTVSSFVPDTVPSQFQKAKPRVYRSNNRPMAPVNHSQLSVVTSTFNSHGSHSATQKRTTIEKRKQTNRWDEKTQHPQDRVAVVSITDDDVAGHLRLDFQCAGYNKRKSIEGDDIYLERSDGDWHAPAHYISWSSLGGEGQLVELKAATRSRFVVQEASEARMTLPMYEDFSNDDVKAQLRVRAFSRWYLSVHHAHQRIREAFLLEELRFAAQDAFVNMAVKSSGCTVPSKLQIGDDASLLRTPFAVWYATGNSFFGESMPPAIEESPKRMANRLQERTTFLNKRLEALGTTELDQGLSSSLPMFIFDIPQLSDGGAGSGIDLASWENQTSECRQCELLLALNDPMIQVAAIAEGVELPDITVMKLENIDVLALATAFVDWWGSTGNIFRQDFLNQEIAEALGDKSVREMLNSNRQGEEMESKIERETYFRSSMTREHFLTQKLQRRRYQRRIDEIFHSGKQAPPILFESLQMPAFVSFRFPVAKVAASEAHGDSTSPEVLELEGETEEEESISGLTTPRENDETNDERRREGEELALMAVEDALSRELDHGYDSASEDEQETVERVSLEPPKRTDFTNSYFFGNLPKTFRINAGGWLAGSGIDNGDEEAEEEERLERERQHQEMLDRLEAERLAEAEREAERMRIEKEMDEKALQMRRIRQLELKKILVYQAEVEARRFEHDEHQNMLREQAAMEAEDVVMKAWLMFLKEQRAAMEHEDRLAAQIALAERHARRDNMRRILAEMTQMDAEDRLSTVAQAEYLAFERKQRLRVQYLTELYEPFEPFFSESKTPSDEMLPAITKRTKQVPKSRKPGYALPLSEVLALDDDVEQELYAARDSRRLRQLMGLPVTTPHSKRMMRIPSEHEIIKTRHDLQLMLPPTDDCAERDRVDLDYSGGGIVRSPYANKASNSNQAGRGEQRVRLPELVHWKAQRDDQRLTDLRASPSPASANQHKHSTKSETKPADQLERQKPSLPFFRGNFIVEGTKSRSQAYAQK